MILKRILAALILTLSCASAAAAKCDSWEDYQLTESTPEWQNTNIRPDTYVDRKVKSKIGTFRLQVKGGIYERQLVETEKYVCANDHGGSSYRYGDEYIHDRGDRWEEATQIHVTFPNGYEMSVYSSEFNSNQFEITFEGLKEHGPFAPQGVLSNSATILKVGEMKLSADDYQKLKKAF